MGIDLVGTQQPSPEPRNPSADLATRTRLIGHPIEQPNAKSFEERVEGEAVFIRADILQLAQGRSAGENLFQFYSMAVSSPSSFLKELPGWTAEDFFAALTDFNTVIDGILPKEHQYPVQNRPRFSYGAVLPEGFRR